ncbi:MAG: tetraacyldisaccharide 4'-kinase, partial [Bacteroidota bacterium]
MRTPEFWHSENTAARLLAPLGLAWQAAGAARRAFVRPWRAPVPVICVGNLVAGGAGKTPVVLSLLTLLRARGLRPAALTRGYGGSAAGPLLVDPARHDAATVGDEALLLAATGPTWLARDRVDGAREAVEEGAEVLVMDDGFQNPGLKKDLSLLVVDAGYGFGNGRVMPAGPLRETPAAGFARADAVVIVGGGDVAGIVARLPHGLPVLRARLEPRDRTLANRRV